MEDDDGEALMAGEESVISEKASKDEDSGAVLPDDTDDSNAPSPFMDEQDSVKPDGDGNVKSSGCLETALVRRDKDSQNNGGKLVSDIDVPKSPRKVNGEVELSKCDTAEHSSDVDYSGDIAEKSKSADDDDPQSEPENLRNSQKRKHEISPLPEGMKDTTKDDGQNSDGNTEYKGFKKRILAQTSVAANNMPTSDNSPLNSTKPVLKCKKAVSESQHVLISHQTLPDGTQSSAQLTEYAQYLGLQPTVKFKCYKCGESGFPSMLKLQEHQNTCLKNCNKIQTLVKPVPPPSTSEPTPSTNFRITRKVYLCSACGTYYENWNLFLHMREVHRRHICLLCLGMFSQADKLGAHLVAKHGIVEGLYASSEQFISEFKGSCFLMCCTCERIFSERENFFDHTCSEGLVINTDKACSLCGLRGAHFPTCRRAFTDSSSPPPQTPPPPLPPPPPPQPPLSSSSSSSVSGAVESPPESTQISQTAVQEHSFPGTKYLIPMGKVAGKKIIQKPNMMPDNAGDSHEKSRDLSDIDDEYDISNAASFCHVNIHEPSEKQKPVAASKVKTCKGKSQDVVTKKAVTELKPMDSSPPTMHVNQKNAEISDNKGDENFQDTDKNSESSSTVLEAKEIQENQECIDNQHKTVAGESGVTQECVHKRGAEPYKPDAETKTDLQNSHKLQSLITEELETSKHMDDDDDESQLQVQTNSKVSLQKEASSKSTPESGINSKTSQQTETKVSSMPPIATEADSESESSESGDGTEESSTSSEASSEDSSHHEEMKDKLDESDADNGDSDKLSLVVDENGSEEEEKTESRKEEADDGDKYNTQDKVNEAEDRKQEEPKSDTEMIQNTLEETPECPVLDDEKVDELVESVQLAGDDVPLLELTLEENLDTMNIQMLLKESVKVSCLNCVYCNHAKKIAVNGKQLALHLLAEHRFAPVVCSDSGELTEADGFVDKFKSSLPALQQMFFNTDSYDNMDETCMRPYDRTYECFHCHFLTTLHKELYVHNRKMHQKTILLCIMCKSNFYSYSELLCHLCPGIYVPESNIKFRCCLCTVDGLPSAFRLMVHLRKKHHACDVCLETTGDQQKLSNHVWKHKLHHLCYRCGIAYRNKPDITKHLFWKHGTESVLCKKCLQKKWPHVYHFCIPPNAFVCEECNSSFSRAVALKVHKRLHAGDLPYACSECEERFISRKLLIKHQKKHSEPSSPKDALETKFQENGPVGEIERQEAERKVLSESHQKADVLAHEDAVNSSNSIQGEESQACDTVPTAAESEGDVADPMVESSAAERSEIPKLEEKATGEKKPKVMDVYDLPPLNLSSESDDSDDDEERKEKQLNVDGHKDGVDMESATTNESTNLSGKEKISEALCQTDEDIQEPVEIVDGIWENFKTYKANLERRENQFTEIGGSSMQKSVTDLQFHLNERQIADIITVIHMDHDYCGPSAGTSHSMGVEEKSEDMLVSEVDSVQHNIVPEQDSEKVEPNEKSEEEKKACDADHNYCYTNTASLGTENGKEEDAVSVPVSAATSSTKKKQKSPKKKQKRSASSSSSDSSSNSDSSTCSCGTNCSCSSSSSSSSGTSSSQSSDSDSSSSEGRRRQAARRERRRERAKKRKMEEDEDATPAKVDSTETAANVPPEQGEVLPVATLVEPDDVELPIRESDLDTDETETDEDFYDQYPQKLANKLFAEKRNQLLLLAAVAPVNNGTMSQSGQSPPPSSIQDPVPRKKEKTKKHKKLQPQPIISENKMEKTLKLNIPTDYYDTQTPVFSKSSMPKTSASSSLSATSLAAPVRSVQSPFLVSHLEPTTPTAAYHSTGSGSETESKRLSKRKRVPKRFYGDSSDDEPEQPPVKWRRTNPVVAMQPAAGCSSSVSKPERVHFPTVNEEKSEEEAMEDSDSDQEDTKKSSSESSNSDSEAVKERDDDVDEDDDDDDDDDGGGGGGGDDDEDDDDDDEDDEDDLSDADSEVDTSSAMETNTVSVARESDTVQQKNENLYCYCQCPYDEVSEMIACDGKDCAIEWFHFECVGIMVPPKGKWFCPDCRKRAAARSDYLLHV